MEETVSTMSNLSQSWMHPMAETRERGLSGKGVFATGPIKKDELVVMWGGTIYTGEQLNRLEPDMKRFILQIDETLYLGPASLDHVDDAEYFNHSCDPNCGMRGQVGLAAMRDIAPGEELTFDYAMAESYQQPFQCNCGSEICRKEIRGNDHMHPELMRRYRGYFSTWLKEKHRIIADSDLLRHYEATGAWGLDTAIDLHDCDPELIRSKEKIHEFTVQLCDRIKVTRYGDPVIVHFGQDERVAGYSLVQLIETSLVSAHFANLTNRIYLDVFSCAYYDAKVTAEFAAEFFRAGSHSVRSILRF